MKPIEKLSNQPGVLAVAYPFPERSPRLEVVDADKEVTAATYLYLPRHRETPTSIEYAAALAELGYTRTSAWRRGLRSFCDVTTTQT